MTMREDCKLPDWPAQEDRSQTSLRQFELHFNALPGLRPNRVAAPSCQHQAAFASANKRKSLPVALLLLGLLAFTQSVHASLFEAWRRTTPGDGVISLTRKSQPVVCAASDGSVYQVIAMPERGGINPGEVESGLIVERLDTNGELLWREVFRDTRSLNSPRSFHLFTAACDLNGNLLISARMGGGHILLKYAASGALLWNSRVPGDFSEWVKPFALVPGPYGMVFLCYNNNRVFGFNDKGFQVFERTLESAEFEDPSWTSARIVSATNLVVAGIVRMQASGSWVPATATISIVSGNLQFFLGPETDPWAVALDGQKRLYAVGHDQLWCIGPSGSNLWQRTNWARDPNTGLHDNWGGSITVLPDDRNDCVFVFVSNTDSTPRVAYLYRLTQSGQWRHVIGDSTASAYSEGKCILDGQGGAFIFGNRGVFSADHNPLDGDVPTLDTAFLQWLSTRQTAFRGYEVLDDRILWEETRYADQSSSPPLAFNAAALPGGGVALVSRLSDDRP